MSATALRDGMQLIAVVMGSDTRDIRNETAKKLLDWGFSNFGVVTFAGNSTDPIPVRGGKAEEVSAEYGEISFLLEKGTAARIKKTVNVAQEVDAPIEEGSVVGRVIYDLDGGELGGVDIVAGETVARLGFGDILSRMLRTFFLCEDIPKISSENGEKPEGGETEMLKSMGILDKRCFL
jgi:D-alanyl-D-alanine carboxypeptidase (penicillin-binding protein 5/6)